ncbi:hypothetical protein [Streptomyces sp. NPDC127084]|uniref:hypothetical protein n=1 Tax=Streptomyces sp. NPDC127084 TaxID=3347133 RepID=UPI0036588715
MAGVTLRDGEPITLVAGEAGSSSASCEDGEIAIAGGYIVTHTDLVVTGNVKSSSEETWLLNVTNTGEGDATFTPYVVCVSST